MRYFKIFSFLIIFLLFHRNSYSTIAIDVDTVILQDHHSGEILYETDVWQGEPVIKQPTPIVHVQPKQFGSDPHKETLDKISTALGSLLDKKAAVTIPSA